MYIIPPALVAITQDCMLSWRRWYLYNVDECIETGLSAELQAVSLAWNLLCLSSENISIRIMATGPSRIMGMTLSTLQDLFSFTVYSNKGEGQADFSLAWQKFALHFNAYIFPT